MARLSAHLKMRSGKFLSVLIQINSYRDLVAAADRERRIESKLSPVGALGLRPGQDANRRSHLQTRSPA
jgi:hypothetical protein